MEANLDSSLEWAGSDEVVQEVRMAREAYGARFEYDLRRMVEDLQAKEKQHPERCATLLPLVPAPTR